MARRRWTPENIETELRSLVEQLGQIPTRRQLEDRGLSGLYKAMRREGGDWTHLLPEPAPVIELAAVRERVATAAYFMHLNGEQGDPVEHWLAAERQIVAA